MFVWPRLWAARSEITMMIVLWTSAKRMVDELKGLALTCGLLLIGGTAI